MSPDDDWLDRDGVCVGGMPLHGNVHISTRDFYHRKGPDSSPQVLKNGAEELLLPEGVFRGRHWDDEGVLPHVGFTVGQEVRGCLGDLHPVHAGLHLQLLHGFPGLGDAGGTVVRHAFLHAGLPAERWYRDGSR